MTLSSILVGVGAHVLLDLTWVELDGYATLH